MSEPAPPGVDAAALRLWLQKWRWYERNSLPWNRARIHWEFMRRGAFVRWPVHGNVLEALLEGRLEVGEHVLLEPGVWITAPGDARVRIGTGTFLNLGVMVASLELVEIGDHCMLANGCYVTDSSHRFDDPDRPVPWQGFTSKGPTRIGDNVWCGVNVVVTSGVTVGERCVIGANSVVTSDIPPFSVAAGVPARVLRPIYVLSGPRRRPDTPGSVAVSPGRVAARVAVALHQDRASREGCPSGIEARLTSRAGRCAPSHDASEQRRSPATGSGRRPLRPHRPPRTS